MASQLQNSRNHEFTLNIDLAPTILNAVGVTPPSAMQGRDMADLYLRNSAPKWRKEFVYEFWDDNPYIPNSMALVQKDFKYIHWTEHNYQQYFDLKRDPYEESDLFQNISVQRMEELHTRMLQSLQHAERGSPI